MILEEKEVGRARAAKEGYQVMRFHPIHTKNPSHSHSHGPHHVAAEYLHALEGRLRIKVPGVKGSASMAADVEELLASIDGIDTAEANPRTGNVLVLYDSDRLTQGDVIETLRAAGFFTETHPHHASPLHSNASSDSFAQVVFRASFEFALQRLITALI